MELIQDILNTYEYVYYLNDKFLCPITGLTMKDFFSFVFFNM